MLHLCDKCGAPTRWYDEKCPRCGATQTVEIPTSPIVLPSFAPSPTPRDEEIAVVLPSSPATAPQTQTAQAKKETSNKAQTAQAKEGASNQTQTAQVGEETSNQTQATQAKKETSNQTQTAQVKEDAPNQTQTAQAKEDASNQTQTTQVKEERSNQTERSQRSIAVRRAVDAWRSVFVSETASVTLPRGRAARYALGIVVELFVCPPCALLAAYFLTRALLADRRANYHQAMLETEKARRSLAVGLGVFAAFLCAFIFYVQSQEIAAPSEQGPNTRLFNR